MKNANYDKGSQINIFHFICISGWFQTYYWAEDSLELLVLLPLSPDAEITGMYHHTWVYVVLGVYVF